MAMVNGGFQDNFAGYGVHLYKISPSGLESPLAPSGLSATPVSNSRIDLSWTDNSNNEAGFKIERSQDGVNYIQIATLEANVTSYANTGLSAGNTFNYRVCAYNAAGDSAYTNVASATTPGGGITFTVTASVSGGHGQVSPASQTVSRGGSAVLNISPDSG